MDPTARPTMTDHEIPNPDPIRRIAHDAAADAVPVDVTTTPDFAAWGDVVDDVAVSIDHSIRSEVQA